MMEISKKDWALFRSKLPEWQEAYMDRLIKEYIALLTGDDKASEKFWALEKRINQDKRDTGVIVDMRRSQMINNLVSLVQEGAINMDDLAEFSEDIQEAVRIWTRGF